MSDQIVIVGAGPAGLGVASRLKRDFCVLEKENVPGGLMRSKVVNGYTFDWAGHIFFTKISRIRDWVCELLHDNFHWQNRESWVFSKDTYTRYPFQANTYGLPPEVVKECLMGLIDVTYQTSADPPADFQDWIYRTYGDGIARHFMIPYNEKLWARDLATMDYHWLGGRVPKPGLSEFIDGALGPGRKDMGPNARFGYPLHGGTAALVERIIAPFKDRIETNSPVRSLDVHNKIVITEDGREIPYHTLVLTLPLLEIVRMTAGISDDVAAAARELEFLSVLCVNVGIREPNPTEKHWIYFPESSFLFHRIFVQGNASPNVCPDGCFSYTAEITYNQRKQVDFATAGERTVEGLQQSGLLHNPQNVDVVDLIDIPTAYIVPKQNRKQIVDTIRKWYLDHDVHLVGRFAEWEYYNMDHSLDAGWTVAERLS